MKTYLVESYTQEIEYEQDSKIIALTPVACYALEQDNIEYSILEDYFTYAEFLDGEEEYFKSEINWFNEFDEFLFNVFPEAHKMKLGLARKYYYSIKFVIDSVDYRCKMLTKFIEKVNPESIIYTSKKWSNETIDHTLFFKNGQSLFSRLIPLICKKYSINFSRVIINDRNDAKASKRDSSSGKINLIDILKNIVKKNTFLINLYYEFKAGILFNKIRRRDNCLNLYFLKFGYKIEKLSRDVVKERGGVWARINGKIVNSLFLGRKYCDIEKNSDNARMEPEFEKGWDRIEKYLKNNTRILSWINDNCRIDVSTIILPRLKYFIEVVCKEILSYIAGYIKFYDNNKIDFVVTPYETEINDFIAVAAAKYSKNTKSVCIQHGAGAFTVRAWDFFEFGPYDIYFGINKEFIMYYEKRSNLYPDVRTKFMDASLYAFKDIIKIGKKRKKHKVKDKRKKVVYVPTFYCWDIHLKEYEYYDTWYYKWQRELLKYFATRKDIFFIWKALPTSNIIYDPFNDIIYDLKIDNVEYRTESFLNFMEDADMVLLDYPSTALYEAAAAKIPVMSLYEKSLSMRASAIKLFGKCLQSFESYTEGINKINEFLNAGFDEYIVSLPVSKLSIVDLLKQNKKL